MDKETQQKVERAMRLLQLFANGETIEVAYSGGKDSDVLLWLAKQSGVKFVARYKNTTIDPPGTIAHCKANGVEILQPKRTFLDIVRAKGFPSRFSRFCCAELKEYATDIRKVATGVRREESIKRSKLYQEPTQCYRGVERVMPMLDFTIADIEEIVKSERLQLHSMYYADDGTLRLDRRLGCIGCPLASRRKRLEEYKQYPKFLLQQIRATDQYYDARTNNGKIYKIKNATEKFLYDLFYSDKMTVDMFNARIKFEDEKELFYKYFGLNDL